jgi:beta-lactamase regulating signal transducer with metallopeptidase domain
VATLLLIERSVSAGTNDHCVAHTHHPHLCLYHGGTWGETAWAVAAVVAAATALSIGLSRRLWGIWRARGARRTLQHVAGARRFRTSTVLIAPAASVFCFVSGVWRPRIFVSSTAWNLLDDLERRAVIEHENAHVAHGDLWRRYVLGSLAALGLPFVAARLLEMWAQAAERLCDARSARETGEPAAVASALIKLSRAARRPDTAFANAFISTATVVDRVEALLRDEPCGGRCARWLGGLIAATAAAAIALCAQYVDPRPPRAGDAARLLSRCVLSVLFPRFAPGYYRQ